jgi:hypothetical protein
MQEWMHNSRFLDLGTGWRLVVNFTALTLYPRGMSAGTHGIGDWVGSRAGLADMEK